MGYYTLDLGVCHLARSSIDNVERRIVLHAHSSNLKGVAMNTDFIYYIEYGGRLITEHPFSSEDEAIIFIYENGMNYGDWDIIEWSVD